MIITFSLSRQIRSKVQEKKITSNSEMPHSIVFVVGSACSVYDVNRFTWVWLIRLTQSVLDFTCSYFLRYYFTSTHMKLWSVRVFCHCLTTSEHSHTNDWTRRDRRSVVWWDECDSGNVTFYSLFCIVSISYLTCVQLELCQNRQRYCDVFNFSEMYSKCWCLKCQQLQQTSRKYLYGNWQKVFDVFAFCSTTWPNLKLPHWTLV